MIWLLCQLIRVIAKPHRYVPMLLAMLSAASSTPPQAPVSWVITDLSGVIIHTSARLQELFATLPLSLSGQTIASIDPSLGLLLPPAETPLAEVSSLLLPAQGLCVQLEPMDTDRYLWMFRSLPENTMPPISSLTHLPQQAWLLPYTRDMISVHDEDGQLCYVSPSVYSLLGYEEARFMQLSIFSIIHPDFKPRIFSLLRQQAQNLSQNANPGLQRSPVVRFQYKIRHKHGNWRWFDTQAYLMYDAQSGKHYVQAASRDITEYKSIQHQLAASQKFLEGMAQAVPDFIYIYDIRSHQYAYANKTSDPITGYSLDELNQMGTGFIKTFLHPEDAPLMLQALQEIQSGTCHSREVTCRIYNKTGQVRWLDTIFTPFQRNAAQDITHLLGVGRDVTDKKTAEIRLYESERKLKQAQEISQIGSWEYDLHLNEAFISEECFSILAIHTNESRQAYQQAPQELLKFVAPKERKQVEDYVNRILTTGEEFSFTYRCHVAGRGAVYVRLRGSCLLNNEGRVQKVYGSVQDITESKLKEMELIKAKVRAESTARAKEQFLSTMTHEIRTPMNAVIGMTHLLLQESPKPEQVGTLNTLKFSAQSLMTLINDILDFNKIEAGKIEFEAVDFHIKDLLSNIEQSFSYKAIEKGIDLELFISAQIPDIVVGDPVRLTQVLSNLINNAIKFTDNGSVTVKLRLDAEDKEEVQINFSVEDTGIGIPEDKLESIFEAFMQVSTDTTRRYGGTGLGLAISKRLVELQNSRIQVVSEVDRGSCFSFSLVFRKSKLEKVVSLPGIQMPAATQALKSVALLLVEDRDINRMVATKFLKQWGIEPDFAMDGLDALEKAQRRNYDLILMDLLMPVMDGYEATQQLRMLPNYQKTPIIALTASALHEEKDRAFVAGVTDYITKPFNPNELYEKLIKYLTRVNQQQLAEVLPSNIVDFQDIDEIFQGDTQQKRQVIEMFIQEIRTLKQAYGEMLLNRDQDRLRDWLHNQEGSSGFFGISPLIQALREGVNLLKISADEAQLKRSISFVGRICEQILAELHQKIAHERV
jgi:PAS domain S-box-containing protein